MRIQSLSYRDTHSEWELAELKFFNDLTLLVGISGVGKTRILQAVSALRRIAQGEEDVRRWGTSWNLTFTDDQERKYQWTGELEEKGASDIQTEDDDAGIYYPTSGRDEHIPHPRFKHEFLSVDGATLIERDEAGIRLNGELTPKLSPYESVVHLLSEEDQIAPAASCFDQILMVDYSDDNTSFRHYPARLIDELREKLSDIDSIRKANYSTRIKLALASESHPEILTQIVDRFTEAFPQVETVAVRRIRTRYEDLYQLQIKERGVARWIPEHKFSSGMSRTLMHLSRMQLWPNGMVVLVDEFENSLGVNCINFVTEDMVRQSRRLQFIITSHHPYIINTVDVANWKIVSRNGMVVSAEKATDLGLESSSHGSFIKLLNLPQYAAGIGTP